MGRRRRGDIESKFQLNYSQVQFCSTLRGIFIASIAIHRTQAAVPKEELEMSMIEGLEPAAPSPSLFVNEHPQRERDAEKDREERRRGVACNKKRSRARG